MANCVPIKHIGLTQIIFLRKLLVFSRLTKSGSVMLKSICCAVQIFYFPGLSRPQHCPICLSHFTNLKSSLQSRWLTLMLHTYTGKNRWARAIARHLRLCSPRTGLHVRSSTPRPVQACAQSAYGGTHSCAFFLDIDMQHQG